MRSTRTPKALNGKLYLNAKHGTPKGSKQTAKKLPPAERVMVIRVDRALITIRHVHALEKWKERYPGLVVVKDTLTGAK